MEKLTIGLPVYNGADFIAGAIEDLLAQTYRDFELIISDNASTDNTESICRRFLGDPRVRYYRHEQNQGAYPNFAYVLRAAATPYFMWAAADDRWKPRFVERCLQVLDARPEIGLACTRWVIRSRMFGLLAIRRFPDLSFVHHPDVQHRVSRFIAQDAGVSHKANFIYGVWRRTLALEAWDAVADLRERGSQFGLDIALLVFALAQMPFHLVDERLFSKTSKYFPSGSLLDRLLARAVGPARASTSTQTHSHGIAMHAELLRSSLRRAGAEGEATERAVECWSERELGKMRR